MTTMAAVVVEPEQIVMPSKNKEALQLRTRMEALQLRKVQAKRRLGQRLRVGCVDKR